jgi:SAM-dependent methyltransferase
MSDLGPGRPASPTNPLPGEYGHGSPYAAEPAPGSFEALVAEAVAADVTGWDFTWLAGRAAEQRPSWGYQRLLGHKSAAARMALDIQTGGGEVLAGTPAHALTTVATESWPPNLERAQRNLAPLGIVVVADADEPPLPFADDTFDLVSSRHPVVAYFEEIARVLAPGGTYFAQHVGPASAHDLCEFFLGPFPRSDARDPEVARRQAEAAGLEVVDLRSEQLDMRFFDVGAVVYYLRKVIWMVPDFSVEKYRDRLLSMHEYIEHEGYFASPVSRFLIEARKPR